MRRPLSARRVMALAAIDDANRTGSYPEATHYGATAAVLTPSVVQGDMVRVRARALLALVDVRIARLAAEALETDGATYEDDEPAQAAADVLAAAQGLLDCVEHWRHHAPRS